MSQRATRKLKRLVGQQRTKNDDVNVISQGNLPEGLPVLRRLNSEGSPTVVVIQLVSEFQWPSDDVANELSKELKKAALVCFVSHKNHHLAEQQVGTIQNAVVVRNPFLVPFDSAPPFPNASDGYQIAVVGRLHAYHKRLDLLVRVFDQAKWRQRDVTVHLFGDGPHKEALMRDVKRRSLEQTLLFRGHVKDVSSIWRECHSLLFCSRIEGLAIALVESMLSGRVPIVTDVGGATELVDDGNNGFVAKGATVHDIDAALERAWQARTEWKDLGQLAAASAGAKIPEDPVAQFAELVLQAARGI